MFAARGEDREDELEDGFAVPWAARVAETPRLAGRVMHFDEEPRSLEGRDLADGRVLQAASEPRIDWLSAGGLMRPFSFGMYVSRIRETMTLEDPETTIERLYHEMYGRNPAG